jgi:putative CocE/NonD family hydrolase
MSFRILFYCTAALAAAAQTPATPEFPLGPPAPLSGFSDDGVLAIYVNEDRVGTVYMGWKKDGSFDNRVVLQVAGQTAERRTVLTPDAEGRWVKFTTSIGGVEISAERTGSTATRTVRGGATTSNLPVRQGSFVFDNNGFGSVSQSLRAYDRAKGGAQKFPLLIIGGGGTTLTIELLEKTTRAVAGRDLSLTRFRYNLQAGGADMFAWAGDDGLLYLLEIPSQKSAIVREGHEALRKAPAPDPLVSSPEYEVDEVHNAEVPMRDGVRLKADIYQPKRAARAPAILIRTPYKKDMMQLTGRFYARRGYVCAIQDVRGRFGSPGVWEPFMNEARDGYDTVEWLAAQPYTNGKVGMIGASYVGWVQWLAAGERPPHLTAIIPNVAPPDPFFNVPYEYGVFFLRGALWWADVLESAATADLSGAALQRTMEKKYTEAARKLPVIDLDKEILGRESKYWREWIRHNTNDAFWRRGSHLDKLAKVRIPVFHQSGWFDGDGIGAKLNYLAMARHGHPYQKLTLGPWGHTDAASRTLGETDFGAAALVDLQRDYLRWFDHWLKGRDSKILDEPLVSLFVMGENKWLHGPVYPLPQTQMTKLYLASGGKANTSKGDGKLTWETPAAAAPSDRYTYDPGDPSPDPRVFEEPEESKKRVLTYEERRKLARTYHDRVTDSRADILVYATSPLEKPVTIAGPVSMKLWASTSARDTDWFVWLMKVDKKGEIQSLTQGKFRARFLRSMAKPRLLTPDKVYEYTIDLWHTGIRFDRGERIRIEVSSSGWPIFSRNLNTGGHNEMETRFVKANQTVHHDAARPSHLLLPVIP